MSIIIGKCPSPGGGGGPSTIVTGVGLLGDGSVGDPAIVNYEEVMLKPTRVEVINSEADFKVQDATTITFEDGVLYDLGGVIVITKRIILGTVAGIRGNLGALIYLGTDAMFTAVDPVFVNFDNLGLIAPAASQMFDFTDTGAVSSRFRLVQCVCSQPLAKIGTFNNFGSVQLDSVAFDSVADGITLQGNLSIFQIVDSEILMNGVAGTMLDLGTSIISGTFSIDTLTNTGAAGNTSISGLIGSGNIAPGTVARVSGLTVSGGMSTVSGVDEQDIRFDFKENSTNFQNSRNLAAVYMTIGGVNDEEVITVGGGNQNVYFEVGLPNLGNLWVDNISDRFDIADGALGTGVATYIGERPIECDIIAKCSVEKQGGGSDEIEMIVAKNWTGDPDPGIADSVASTRNNNPTSLTVFTETTLNQGDNIRLLFRNTTGTANMFIKNLSFTIKGV